MGVARSGTKLEVDDPDYCKECGAELPTGDITARDDEGRLLIWKSCEGGWETVETCPECWVEKRISRLRNECAERYGGHLAEVLARD